jgi:predicted component of type VI protein secretion system
LQELLQEWLNNWVLRDPIAASDAEKARRPLGRAEIEVVEWNEATLKGVAYLRLQPVFQLEGHALSPRMVLRFQVH